MNPSPDTLQPSKLPPFVAGDKPTILDRDRANAIIRTANQMLSFRDAGAVRVLHAQAGICIVLNQ